MKKLLIVIVLLTGCDRGLLPSTDNIVVVGSQTTGTGFFIDSSTVATAAHVVCGNEKVLITYSDNTNEMGQVTLIDTAKDFALITVMAIRKPIDLAVIKPKQNDFVMAIGHPATVRYAFTRGYVMKPLHMNEGINYIIVDLNTFHGYSGAPVLNRKGKCIGMIQAFFRGTGITIALSIPELKLLTE